MRKASVFSFQFKTIALVSSTALVATASLQALSNNFKNISLKESIGSFVAAGTKVINGVSGLGAGSNLLYGSVYSAGSTVYNVGSFAKEKIKNTVEKSYNSINNGITWSTGNFGVVTSFLQKAYDAVVNSAPTVGNAILDGGKTVYSWLKTNWQSTIVAKIKEYSDLNNLWKNLGLESDVWTKIKENFQSSFKTFVSSPKDTVLDWSRTFYRITFKLFGPWAWTFLDVGIFQKAGYSELWEKIIKAGKFTETLKEVMKFFKKFSTTLERMLPETRYKIVESFLKEPEKLLAVIQKLNNHKGQGKANVILDPSTLELLLKAKPEDLETTLAVKGVSDVVIGGTGGAIGFGAHAAITSAESILDVITENKGTESIGKPVEKIITTVSGTASDLVTTVVSGLWSIFKPKKNENSQVSQGAAQNASSS